jgi:hypothetical protein
MGNCSSISNAALTAAGIPTLPPFNPAPITGELLFPKDFVPGIALLGTTRSPYYSTAILCLLAAGICSSLGPFWALPGEFLTGFSAAAGIALINSVGNLGG